MLFRCYLLQLFCCFVAFFNILFLCSIVLQFFTLDFLVFYFSGLFGLEVFWSSGLLVPWSFVRQVFWTCILLTFYFGGWVFQLGYWSNVFSVFHFSVVLFFCSSILCPPVALLFSFFLFLCSSVLMFFCSHILLFFYYSIILFY